jgi:hypothetical protein
VTTANQLRGSRSKGGHCTEDTVIMRGHAPHPNAAQCGRVERDFA